MDDPTRLAAEDLAECLTPLNPRTRAMFGGYCVYVDDKVVGLVSDGRVFVKPSSADAIVAGYGELAPAYPGAKDTWRLPLNALYDTPERVVDIFRATANALPARAIRKRR